MEVVTTLLASNIFPENCSFEDGSPFFLKVGYVSCLEGPSSYLFCKNISYLKVLSESFAMMDLRHRPLMSMPGLATKVQLGHLFFFFLYGF